MAGGCYALQAPDDRWVVKSGGGYTATGNDSRGRRTDPLPGDRAGRLPPVRRGPAVRRPQRRASPPPLRPARAPSGTSPTTAAPSRSATLSRGARRLDHAPVPPRTSACARPTGCAPWPEAEVNVTGQTFAGLSAIQEVRGYLDDHIHHMTPGFLGGGIHCGTPWAKYGVEYALKDCVEHETADGQAALARDRPERQELARPHGLADLQGLAGTRFPDPRGHLLQVGRACVARRTAPVRQSPRREQRPVPDLSRARPSRS